MKINENFEFSKVRDLDAFIQNFYAGKTDEIISDLKNCFRISQKDSSRKTSSEERNVLTEQEADLFFDILKYVDFSNNHVENRFPVQIITKRHGWNNKDSALTANDFIGEILFNIRSKTHFEVGTVEEDGISCASWLIECYDVKYNVGHITFGKDLYPFLKAFCQIPEVQAKIRQEEI